MFLINIIDITIDIKIPIIAFFFFYRIIYELMVVKFLTSKYHKINYAYKLIFIFDYLILLIMNTEYFQLWIYPLLIMEMTLFVFFLISLVLFFFGNQKIYGKAAEIMLFSKSSENTLSKKNSTLKFSKKGIIVLKGLKKPLKDKILKNNQK